MSQEAHDKLKKNLNTIEQINHILESDLLDIPGSNPFLSNMEAIKRSEHSNSFLVNASYAAICHMANYVYNETLLGCENGTPLLILSRANAHYIAAYEFSLKSYFEDFLTETVATKIRAKIACQSTINTCLTSQQLNNIIKEVTRLYPDVSAKEFFQARVNYLISHQNTDAGLPLCLDDIKNECVFKFQYLMKQTQYSLYHSRFLGESNCPWQNSAKLFEENVVYKPAEIYLPHLFNEEWGLYQEKHLAMLKSHTVKEALLSHPIFSLNNSGNFIFRHSEVGMDMGSTQSMQRGR